MTRHDATHDFLTTYLNLCAQIDAQYRELIEFDSSFCFLLVRFQLSKYCSVLSKIKTYLTHHINTYENIS